MIIRLQSAGAIIIIANLRVMHRDVFQNTDYPIVRRHTEKFNQSTPFHQPFSLSLFLAAHRVEF